MVPWPVALLALYYGVLAATSAATAYRLFLGGRTWPWVAAVTWCVLASTATYGLALLRPWARRVAIIASVMVMLNGLANAALWVAAKRPAIGVIVALACGLQMVIVRYLGRPAVKVYFQHE